MAVVYVKQVAEGVMLGLWHFDESPKELAQMHPALSDMYVDLAARYRHETRIMERLAIHALLMRMEGLSAADELPIIGHEESGKPLLHDGRFLSVSHTKGMAALMLSDNHPVGVDIEYVSDRVGRIAHMVLRDDEVAVSVRQQLVVWCAKEAAYKLFSSDRLAFAEMKVHPFEMDDSGTLCLTNLKRQSAISLYYQFEGDYVLVYTSL